MQKHFSFILSVLFLLSLTVCQREVSAETTFITIGTAALTGIYYPTGGAIAKTVNKQREKYGLRCTVESTDGSVYNVNAVLERELDFGIVQSDIQYQAVNGVSNWKELGKQKKLRAVFSIYPESCALIATVDSGIKTLMDIKGKHISLGNHGSGHLVNTLDVLHAFGLDQNQDIRSVYLDPIDAPVMLQDGGIDAFFYTVGHPNGTFREASSGARKVKFISITGDKIDTLVTSLPYYSKMVIPVKYYPGVENNKDVETFGVSATLVTSADVSDDVVYAITKTVFENLESFKKLHPAYELISRKSMLKGLTAPIHKGAMRYYRDVGLK